MMASEKCFQVFIEGPDGGLGLSGGACATRTDDCGRFHFGKNPVRPHHNIEPAMGVPFCQFNGALYRGVLAVVLMASPAFVAIECAVLHVDDVPSSLD